MTQPARTIGLFNRSGQPVPLTGEYDQVFTANPRAARACGVSHYPLAAEARRLVTQAGLTVCPELKSRRLLRRACADAGEADPYGASERYMPFIRESLHSGLDPAELSAAGPRGEQLARIRQLYLELLAAEQLIDPGQLYWSAANVIQEKQQVAVVGYTVLGRGEQQFIDAIAGPGSLVCLPQDDVLPGPAAAWSVNRGLRLQDSGWQVAQLSPAAQAPVPQISAVTHPDVWAEVRSVLARTKQLLTEGVSPDDVVLLTRAENEYGPVVQAVAWEYGLPVNSYNPVQLQHTRIGELLQLMITCALEDFPFEPATRLSRHAFGPRLSAPQWRQARQLGATGASAWQACGLDTSLLRWPARTSAREYARLVDASFGAWDTERLASLSSHDALALQALRDGLNGLDQLYPAGSEVRLSDWQQDVTELLQVTTVAASPGRGGLELHTPLSVGGASYRHVFVLGAIEGQLPSRLKDDPVLPWHLRARLSGLDDITQTVNRELATIRSALAGATETLHFTVPLRFQNGETTPSPLLHEFGLSLNAGSHPVLASPEEERQYLIRQPPADADAVLAGAHRSLLVEQRRQSAEPFDEYDGITGLPIEVQGRPFSVSQLSQLGQCPYRWFASYVLGLAAEEEHLAETDALTLGSLYHEVLDHALKTLLESGDTDPTGNLAALIPDSFAQVERSLGSDGLDLRSLPGWSLARTEHLERLQRAVRSADFWAGEPIATEQAFDADWRGLHMRGRIDRIDRSSEGLTLIDIKSGSYVAKVQDGNRELKADLQLPVYAEVAADLYPADTILGSRYFSIRGAKEVRSQPPPAAFLDSFVAQVRGLLGRGEFPVQPDLRQAACDHCDYRSVCRVGRRQEHKPRWSVQS